MAHPPCMGARHPRTDGAQAHSSPRNLLLLAALFALVAQNGLVGAVKLDDYRDSARERDWKLFQAFQKKYGKVYSTPEEVAKRFSCLRESLQLVKERNAKLDRERLLPGAHHDVTSHGDLCQDEYAKLHPEAPIMMTLHFKPLQRTVHKVAKKKMQ